MSQCSGWCAKKDGRKTAREVTHSTKPGACCIGRRAEGAGRFSSTNSDPHMLVLFRRFLTEALAASRDDIRFSINVYTNNGLSLEEIERYWIDLLDLPARTPEST